LVSEYFAFSSKSNLQVALATIYSLWLSVVNDFLFVRVLRKKRRSLARTSPAPVETVEPTLSSSKTPGILVHEQSDP